MKRKLAAPVLVAALVSFTVASGHALAGGFNAGSDPVGLRAHQGLGVLGRFRFDESGEAVACRHTTFASTVRGLPVKRIAVPMRFGLCGTMPLRHPGEAGVDTEGCHLVFESGIDRGSETEATIDCAQGHAIRVIAPGCRITLPPQAQRGLRYLSRNTGHAEIEIGVNLSGLRYKLSGRLCFLLAGDGRDLDFVDSLTIKGYRGSPRSPAQVAVKVE